MLLLGILVLLLQIEIPGFSAADIPVSEIRLRSDSKEARIRPLESVVIQVLSFGQVEDSEGNLKQVRLQVEEANFSLRTQGTGWLSKPFRYQGREEIPFYEPPETGLAAIILGRASTEFAQKDSVLYTAPAKPGRYSISGSLGGETSDIVLTVDPRAPSTHKKETTSFRTEAVRKDNYRLLAEYYSPFVAQETWFEPKADFLARFDFDGDWKGDNNWDALYEGSSQAYVYYAAVETGTHWYLIFNFFHPRDYSDRCVGGTCHENDNEGLILTIRKDGTRYGDLQVMETLAHNHIYSYRRDQEIRSKLHNIDGELELYRESHPVVFIEAGGHGVYGSSGSHSRYSLREDKFSPATGGITYIYKRKAERPSHPNQKRVGYELLPIYEHWWKKSQEANWAKGMMFDAYYEYRPEGDRPPAAYPEIAGAFLGRRHGSNKAKPFWGWHDQRSQKNGFLATGQWGLDPAYAVSRNLTMPEPHSLDYIHNPYLDVAAVGRGSGKESAKSPPSEEVRERRIASQGTKLESSGSQVASEASNIPGTPLEVMVGAVIQEAERGNFFFDGEIDEEVIFRIRGSSAAVEVIKGRPVTARIARFSIPFPTDNPFSIRLKRLEGRGDVELMERPSEGNEYTTTIRVRDDKRASDRYRISVDWIR